ncbi:MAG: TlpA family protein disulfide reductase [Chloroflexota bacterium]|nr:TlpA family protein disulfide reductase [Chloroflexota bacterium]
MVEHIDPLKEARAKSRTERLSKWLMIGGGVLALLALLGLILGVFLRQGPARSSGGVVVGDIAPDFQLRNAATDQLVSLSSLRGKPVWVNFWTTHCDPCKNEMADIKNSYDRNKSKNLVVLGIDDQENAGTVNKFTQINAYDWTFLLDSDGSVSKKYGVTGLPTQIFIGKDGVVKAVQLGTLAPNELKSMLEQVTTP